MNSEILNDVYESVINDNDLKPVYVKEKNDKRLTYSYTVYGRKDNYVRVTQDWSVVDFTTGLGYGEYKLLAQAVAWGFGGAVAISIAGTYINGHVGAGAGGFWRESAFVVDFNDRGRITGNYTLKKEHKKQQIPDQFAEKLKLAIQMYMEEDSFDDKGKFVNTALFDFLGCSKSDRRYYKKNFEDLYEFRDRRMR